MHSVLQDKYQTDELHLNQINLDLNGGNSLKKRVMQIIFILIVLSVCFFIQTIMSLGFKLIY